MYLKTITKGKKSKLESLPFVTPEEMKEIEEELGTQEKLKNQKFETFEL